MNDKPASAELEPIEQSIAQSQKRVERSRKLLSLIDRMLGKKDEKSNKPH